MHERDDGQAASRRSEAGPTANAFGLETSVDMLMKLERELRRLAWSTQREDLIDHGLNVAMTAWHMADWVWPEIERSDGHRDELATKAGIRCDQFDQKAFKRHVLNACPELRYCQIIATSAKHLSYTRRPQDPEFRTKVDAAQITWVNNQGEPIFFTNNDGQPITWTSNALDLYIEGETRLRAADVFVGAVIWWGQFLKEGTA